MKRFEFPLDSYQVSWIFSPIRKRSDIIGLLVNAIKIMLVNEPPPENLRTGSMILQISKMSRLFFISEFKVFSINFPFTTMKSTSGFHFSSPECEEIDNRVTSVLLEILESSSFHVGDDVLHFADPIHEASMHHTDIWALMRTLIFFEDGYVRYDLDAERANGHRHPLNHIDVFYSSGASFKLGLHNALDIVGFSDILDSSTDCHYIQKVV